MMSTLKGKNKNALRQHLIAVYTGTKEIPSASEFELLGEGILSADDDSDENVEDYADYAGDGTPEQDVVSVSRGRSFSGNYTPKDPAQEIIANMRFESGVKRWIWYKEIDSEEEYEYVGLATVTDITAGGGAAEDWEEFACSIRWKGRPIQREVGTA